MNYRIQTSITLFLSLTHLLIPIIPTKRLVCLVSKVAWTLIFSESYLSVENEDTLKTAYEPKILSSGVNFTDCLI